MRKLLVSAWFAVALLISAATAQSSKADDGYFGGYGDGARSSHSHYSRFGSRHGSSYDCYGGQVIQYQTAIVPVYPGGIYQSYSFSGSPIGGFSNFGQIGLPYGDSPYGAGYGSNLYGSGHRRSPPRVQLRIGF